MSKVCSYPFMKWEEEEKSFRSDYTTTRLLLLLNNNTTKIITHETGSMFVFARARVQARPGWYNESVCVDYANNADKSRRPSGY